MEPQQVNAAAYIACRSSSVKLVLCIVSSLCFHQMSDALGGLSLAFLVVIAAVEVEVPPALIMLPIQSHAFSWFCTHSQFARSFILALSIASHLIKPAMHLESHLSQVFPAGYFKWTPVCLSWSCNLVIFRLLCLEDVRITQTTVAFQVGLACAWYLQQFLPAITSSIKGEMQFGRPDHSFCLSPRTLFVEVVWCSPEDWWATALRTVCICPTLP